jgi:hypothetical protein
MPAISGPSTAAGNLRRDEQQPNKKSSYPTQKAGREQKSANMFYE